MIHGPESGTLISCADTEENVSHTHRIHNTCSHTCLLSLRSSVSALSLQDSKKNKT